MSRYPYLPVVHTDDDDLLGRFSPNRSLANSFYDLGRLPTIVQENPLSILAKEKPRDALQLASEFLASTERRHALDVVSSDKQKRDDVLSSVASVQVAALASAAANREPGQTFIRITTETPVQQSLLDRVLRVGTQEFSLTTTLEFG